MITAYFKDFFYVPELGDMTLISLSCLEDKGYYIEHTPGLINIALQDRVPLIQCFRLNNLFHMNINFLPIVVNQIDSSTAPPDSTLSSLALTASNLSTTTLWHHRLGHYSLPIIKESLKSINVNITSMDFCSTCPLAKQRLVYCLIGILLVPQLSSTSFIWTYMVHSLSLLQGTNISSP